MAWFRKRPKQPDASAGRDLRAQALRLEPTPLGLTPTPDQPNVWAILMETGLQRGAATLFSVVDGTTSLYYSTGGGVIGAGERPSVRATLPAFFRAAEGCAAQFSVASTTPLPDAGRVRFYLRTFTGTLSAEAAQDDLATMHHPLSPLFQAGHAVLSAVRGVANA
jgi:hypothetical protein